MVYIHGHSTRILHRGKWDVEVTDQRRDGNYVRSYVSVVSDDVDARVWGGKD